MSDDVKETDTGDDGQVGGERLRAARRANDISIRDIAKELHLDEAKVRALEQNEFDVLGAPVFAKGHLRKYAELVGVAEDDIMTDYYKMARSAGVPPIIGTVRKRPRDINIVPWIQGLLIVAVAAAAAYWWVVLRPAETAPSRISAPRTQPVVRESVAPGTAGEATSNDAGETSDDQETVNPVGSETREPTTGSDAATGDAGPVAVGPGEVPAEDLVSIRLSFSGDCWTEVSDATGERLFYDLGAAGRVVMLSGEPPFRVVFGDADNVTITVNGEDYPIPDSARRGRLARLTINPD